MRLRKEMFVTRINKFAHAAHDETRRFRQHSSLLDLDSEPYYDGIEL